MGSPAMAVEPSGEDVEGFRSITASHSHAEAVQWLKAYSNDVNRAVNAFFEDPDALHKQTTNNTWEESQFHTDRTDNAQQSQNQRSFTVHASDALSPNVFNDNVSAPSRPPTRNSNRRTELSVDHEIGSSRQLTLAEQHQRDMDQAMALSIGQEQETGVTDAANPNFGVANREHYETNAWAMIPAPVSHAREILLNPVPADRTRDTNTPAFLKPSPGEHRLPALIKILQAIPLSREALLNREHLAPDYGYNSEWWDGYPIKSPRIVSMSSNGQHYDELEVVHEVQRLMAFLEKTDRAYGSAEALASFEGIRKSTKLNIIANFLEQWRAATERLDPDAILLNIFRGKGTKLSHSGDEEAEGPVFQSLQVNVDADVADSGLSLYEAFDDIIWSSYDSDFEEVYLQTVADVFILEVSRLNPEKAGLGIDIPAVWYSDRYLESSKEQAKAMLAGKAAARKEIENIDRSIGKLLQYTPSGPGRKTLNASDLLNAAAAYFEVSMQNTGMTVNTSGNFESQTSGPDLEKHAAIAQELKSVASRVEQKVKTLEGQKLRARETLLEFSKLYTNPSSNPKEPPYHKYTLQGVCTEPHIVCVLEKTQPDDEDDLIRIEAEDWQWWELRYDRAQSKPISRRKVQELEVLTAAKDQASTALLVYASERATCFNPGKLPPQLLSFVQSDNDTFAKEFDTLPSPQPASPAKRKADGGGEDDIGSKLYHSPPQAQNSEIPLSMNATDPTLPTYVDTPSPPTSLRHIVPTQRKPRTVAASYDDIIPTSLQATGPTIDPNSMALDDDYDELGQEMQDRGRGIGLLQRGEGEKYALGDYVPEISMEDRDDDEVEEIEVRRLGVGREEEGERKR